VQIVIANFNFKTSQNCQVMRALAVAQGRTANRLAVAYCCTFNHATQSLLDSCDEKSQCQYGDTFLQEFKLPRGAGLMAKYVDLLKAIVDGKVRITTY